MLRKKGWLCLQTDYPHVPFNVLAARTGTRLLIRVKADEGIDTRRKITQLTRWAKALNARAEVWHLPEKDRVLKEVIHELTAEVQPDSESPISTEKMRELEQRVASYGLSQLLMMENAGRSIAEAINSFIGGVKQKRVVVVAGLGNNGGDGMAAARHLSLLGASVTVILLGEMEQIKTQEARINWNVLTHIPTISLKTVSGEVLQEELMQMIMEAHVVVDAIFGTGIRGEIREPYKSAIKSINSCKALVVAVDVPSGLDPDSGTFPGVAVRADLTVTLHLPKPGLLKGKNLVGELLVGSIGIPPNIS